MTTETVQQLTLKELTALVFELKSKIEAIESKTVRNEAEREMTEADALSILTGEHKDLKHKDAANKLGLSYGQIYSCRLQFTFKGVHKKLAESGFKNPWVK